MTTTTSTRGRAGARRPSRMPWLIAALVVVVGLAAIVAVMGTGGGTNKNSTGVETAPVTVTGSALPAADGSGLIDPGTDPAAGKTVPVLTGSTPTGAALSYPVPNKPAVYLFVAHWCPHCQAEVPRIVGWMQSGQIPTGLLWRTVSTAVTPSRGNYPPSAWFTKVRWDQPVMVDSTAGDAATAFGLQSFPYLLFVDAHGVVKQRATGELTIDQLKAAIATITG